MKGPARRRLDQLLASLGYATRSGVRGLLADGRVTVSGVVARRPEERVVPEEVTVDGGPLDHPGGVLVALHKPVGHVCSHDAREGPRVFDLLPERWNRRNPAVEAVGRLDKDTSGLLLLTDDHLLLHRLTSPRHDVPKRYDVVLDGPIPDGLAAAFASGSLRLAGELDPCRPAEVWPHVGGRPERVVVVLQEGRHRQVRRMFAHFGRQVVSLHREAVGSLELGGLEPGAWRSVSREEIGVGGAPGS